LPFDEWLALVEHLTVIKAEKEAELDAINWAIGDAILYGECEYGEKYAQALDAFDLSRGRLQNIVWACNKVPTSRRREALSFGHHERVAALPASQADRLLAECEREGWSTRELYEQRLDLEARRDGKDPDVARAERALAKAADALERVGDRKQRLELVRLCILSPLRMRAVYDGLDDKSA
jgi:hypothetical protein